MLGDRVTEGELGTEGCGLVLSHGVGGSTLVSFRGSGRGSTLAAGFSSFFGCDFDSALGCDLSSALGCDFGSTLVCGFGSALGGGFSGGAFGMGVSCSGSSFTDGGSGIGSGSGAIMDSFEKPKLRSRGSMLCKSMGGMGGGGGMF